MQVKRSTCVGMVFDSESFLSALHVRVKIPSTASHLSFVPILPTRQCLLFITYIVAACHSVICLTSVIMNRKHL